MILRRPYSGLTLASLPVLHVRCAARDQHGSLWRSEQLQELLFKNWPVLPSWFCWPISHHP
jgi:hypothetical protein